MAETHDQVRVVWTEPFYRLAAAYRAEAEALRTVAGDEDRARLREADADRLERTIGAAAAGEWLRTEDAAPLLRINADSVRARCRRQLAGRGLARKQGGTWYVHVDALPRRTAA